MAWGVFFVIQGCSSGRRFGFEGERTCLSLAVSLSAQGKGCSLGASCSAASEPVAQSRGAYVQHYFEHSCVCYFYAGLPPNTSLMPFKLKRLLYIFHIWRRSQVGIIQDLHWHNPCLLLEIHLLSSESVHPFKKCQGGVGSTFPSPCGTHVSGSLILKGIIP